MNQYEKNFDVTHITDNLKVITLFTDSNLSEESKTQISEHLNSKYGNEDLKFILNFQVTKKDVPAIHTFYHSGTDKVEKEATVTKVIEKLKTGDFLPSMKSKQTQKEVVIKVSADTDDAMKKINELENSVENIVGVLEVTFHVNPVEIKASISDKDLETDSNSKDFINRSGKL